MGARSVAGPSGTVLGHGSTLSRLMILGQSPGPQEIEEGRPFVGRAGEELTWYFDRHGLKRSQWYITNVVKELVPPKVAPTAEQVERWTPHLIDEIRKVQPRIIVAVGAYATKWLLGTRADMDTCHGMPHEGGAFDEGRRERAAGAVVLPAYHPAAGLYDGDVRALCDYDYRRAADVVKSIAAGRRPQPRRDEYEGREKYHDVSGHELALALRGRPDLLALDTEGTPRRPWSIQVSTYPGTAYVLRCSREDFSTGIERLSELAGEGLPVIFHNAMYDLEMCLAMGLDLRRARLWDSMYAAFLLRLEPQSLKALAWRWLGMRMRGYRETVAGATADKQTAYLLRVILGSLRGDWQAPTERIEWANDATYKLKTPEPLYKSAVRALKDYYERLRDEEDEGEEDEEGQVVEAGKGKVNLAKRWAGWDEVQRVAAERVTGPMPHGTLDDIDLDDAVGYAGRDSDATCRLYPVLKDELERSDLTRTMAKGMKVLPVFEEIQREGMPVSRSRLQALHDTIDANMRLTVKRLARDYNNGRPFNPMSGPQVRALMMVRGLEGTKRTKTDKVSTAKKSIEGLKYVDEAIAGVFEWREMEKVRDTFCRPALRRLAADGPDLTVIRGQVKTTRVATRRIAMADPNLLQIPIRTKLGQMLRACYVIEDGYVMYSADLSQIELRYAAHLTGDPLLCRLFNEGADVYSETASRLFHVPIIKKGEAGYDVFYIKYRDPAKRITLGTLYGLQGEGLLTQLLMAGALGYSMADCDRMQEGWFEVYPEVRRYIDEEMTPQLERDGYVRDHGGMYRYLPGIWSRDMAVRAEAIRIALSHQVSGGAQTMIQDSMPWVWRRLVGLRKAGVDVRMRLQFHDEIITSCPEEWADDVADIMVEGLTEHCGLDLAVPVLASGQAGRSWVDLK